ncbi:MAG: tetratricopeptide repeat protein [Anaerolineaceae bacterium]|nr:tetratricopeptide repeat protein [Anaerolineaceae bacterium]
MAEGDLEMVEQMRTEGDSESALKILEKVKSSDRKAAEYQYALGRVLEDLGRYEEALDAYQAALKKNPCFRAARFRLGFLCDLRGDEARAIECYEACVELYSRDQAALLNLGTIYESKGYVDQSYYDRAIKCYRKLLEINPNHARARLALHDTLAAKVMFYDEEQERRLDRRNQVLEIPVTDFELSVRSRNCLKKMNVHVLGDLIMHTEADLLSYKNFGETSLAEIKEVLVSKGLYLGQGLEQQATVPVVIREAVPEAAPAPSSTVGDILLETIDFSIRCRKCFQRLGLQTLNDLARMTEQDLMNAKNFGQTSLNEVKQKLRRYSLSLKD